MKQELLQALQTIAAQQGRDPNELLAEFLRGQIPQQLAAPQRQPEVAQQVEVLPPQQYHPPAQPRPQLQLSQRYAGVPNPQTEGDMEALARYLEAESGPQGVFGDGGMSAGGVFGSAPVATAGHDPTAEQRNNMAQLARLAPQMLQALAQRPPPAYPAAYPPYPPPPPPPQQPVRMVTHTSVTYYEGPPPQMAPQPQAPQLPQVPWPWGRR